MRGLAERQRGRLLNLLSSTNRISLCAMIAVAGLHLSISSRLCVAGPAPTKVKIEATELDRRLLLQKLNKSSHNSFILDEQNFSYKIVFSIEQQTSPIAIGGIMGSTDDAYANVEVQDSEGRALFKFRVRSTWGTEKGAYGAATKEIIKRLRAISSRPQ